MALVQEFVPSVKTGSLSDASTGKEAGEILRDYEPKPGVEWRFGKPSYLRVNREYFKNRTNVLKEGSLEAVVSKVVKNWEVESHHVLDPKDWTTMDTSKFKAVLNQCPAIDAQVMADIGPYNMLLGETPGYSAKKETFESANVNFSRTFPGTGFAWECLEVYSGPPNVVFKWRHWGNFTGTYTDNTGKEHKGDGKLVEVFGLCKAVVNDKLVIEHLEVWYDPQDMIKPLLTNNTDGAAAAKPAPTANGSGAGTQTCCPFGF